MTAGVKLYTIPFIFCHVWAGSSALPGLPPLQAVNIKNINIKEK